LKWAVCGYGATSIAPNQGDDESKIFSIRTKGLFLREVHTPNQREAMKDLIVAHHSYKQNSRFVGRQINWLIEFNGQIVGAIGIGSVVMFQPQIFYDYVGVKCNINACRTFYLNKIAVNWRFTLTPNAPKNIGSQTLAIMAKIAPKRWKSKFGDELALLITLVELPRKGTVYKAAGWDFVGQTKASRQMPHMPYGKDKHQFGKTDKTAKWIAVSQSPSQPKLFFAKPLRTDWRNQVIRKPEPKTIENEKLTELP